LGSTYLPAQQYLAEDQLNMRKIQSAMLEAVATPKPERRGKMKNDLNDKYSGDFMAAWNSYKDLMGSDPAVQPKLADTEQKWQDYKKVSGDVIDLTIAGRMEDASALYGGDGIKKLNALKESLTDLQDNCNEEIKASQQANSETSAATNRMMIIISVVAFLLALPGGQLHYPGDHVGFEADDHRLPGAERWGLPE
jgi:methyl-accepting chemotaxis protein